MSKKKEINVFNIAFLDLLSGALGAVIILFIAVPKQESPQPSSQKACVKEQTTDCQVENKLAKQVIKEKEQAIEIQKQKIKELMADVQELKVKKLQEKIKPKKVENDNNSGYQVGFKFRGKKIVFLIDISGSMTGSKIEQVKAGLKMLIASMGPEYSVDVVYYPYSRTKDYYPLWAVIQPLATASIKNEIYRFLQRLSPRGSTPTRNALKYVLGQYTDITDVVLLSDGSPTLSGSRTRDDSDDILEEIKRLNAGRVQINTIGVGKNFTSSTNTELYRFLKKLSSNSKGFFHGF